MINPYQALAAAAAGLTATGRRPGVLVGGRATVEDAYAYAKFARVVLGTNDIDFRARAHTEEEAAFLTAAVAGTCDPDSSASNTPARGTRPGAYQTTTLPVRG